MIEFCGEVRHLSAFSPQISSPQRGRLRVIQKFSSVNQTFQSLEVKMTFYDEIEIEDMTYHESTTLYTYPCPCGDQFEISLADLRDGEEVAVCPSCSLMIKVIYEAVS